MPAYDFRCTNCRHTFEIRRPSSDTNAPVCPLCGAATKRVFTPVGVHFKGSGFYATDSRVKNPAGVGTSTETKPESKPEATPACPASGGAGCAGCPAAE